MIQEVSSGDLDIQFQAKVHGTRLLSRVLEGRAPDFCLLHSSLASVLGGLGFAAYAAANSFMDTFATQRARLGRTRWISVNWDAWRDVPGYGPAPDIAGRVSDAGLAPQEGVEVLRRVLALDGSAQIVVSTTDLEERLRTWVEREQQPAEAAAVSTSLHARPNMQTSYVAPTTELELQVVAVWQKLLGIGEIGIHDSFFELGGNSLLGTQLASQLRSIFQVELPLRRLFEDPTVACVARIIEEERGHGGGARDKIADALNRVQQLSEDEVRARLAKGAGPLVNQDN
jgi:hypothetical protein